MRLCNVTGENWVILAFHVCPETEINAAASVGLGPGCPQVGWPVSFADEAPWCKTPVETNPNDLYPKAVRRGKYQQERITVCRDHLCFFSISKMGHLLSQFPDWSRTSLVLLTALMQRLRPPTAFPDLRTCVTATTALSSLGFTHTHQD